MDAELLKLCDQVFTAGAKAAVKKALMCQRDGFFKCRITGRLWAVADVEKAERVAAKAMIARAWWDRNRPGWAPSMSLPVNDDEICSIGLMEHDEPLEVALVAHYASSLAQSDYDFNSHPDLEAWFCNFLSLRPSMRRRLRYLNLKPKPMPGFNWRCNRWEPPVGKPELPNGLIETGLARR
jgi:hypothetical protein